MNKILKLFPLGMIIPLLSGCLFKIENHVNEHAYAVYLGASEEDIDKFGKYDEIVIDAQYFSKESIDKIKESGSKVISYLNIGSIENFRSYYNDYVDLTIGEYEHWEEERWVDVSSKRWQDFILNDLADQLIAKGVFGFFVDNVDVYYNFHTPEIYEGVETLLTRLRQKQVYTIINGGDTFVYEYFEKNRTINDILGAVNQETVFSKINWDDGTFGKNDKEEREYFQEYVVNIQRWNARVYLLEYTTDEKLIEEIKNYCAYNVFDFYISPNLELLP